MKRTILVGATRALVFDHDVEVIEMSDAVISEIERRIGDNARGGDLRLDLIPRTACSCGAHVFRANGEYWERDGDRHTETQCGRVFDFDEPHPNDSVSSCQCGKATLLAGQASRVVDGYQHARVLCLEVPDIVLEPYQPVVKIRLRTCACGEVPVVRGLPLLDQDNRTHDVDECTDAPEPDNETSSDPTIESQPNGYINWSRVSRRLEDHEIDEFQTFKSAQGAAQCVSQVMRKYQLLKAVASEVEGEPETRLISVTRYSE